MRKYIISFISHILRPIRSPKECKCPLSLLISLILIFFFLASSFPQKGLHTDAYVLYSGSPPALCSVRALPLDGIDIVIDPGHGLYYNGNSWVYQRPDCWGLVEDELTVEIASYLFDYLDKHTGANLHVTRELDKNASIGISGQPKWQEGAWCHLRGAMGYSGFGSLNQDLTIRPEYANQVNGDIFISIHTNAGGGSARGTMTIWGGQDTGTGGGSPSADLALANDIHPPLVAECGTQDRGVLKDEDICGFSLCVLRETNMPGCLVEVAFHDNYDDNQLLHQDSFKESAGRGMFFGIFDYYGLERPDLDLPLVDHMLTEVFPTEADSLEPDVAELDNGDICLVWLERSQGESSILMTISGDRGQNWSTPETLLTAQLDEIASPTFTQSNDGTWVLSYQGKINDKWRVCYRLSTDSGASWGEEQMITDLFPGSNHMDPNLHRTRYGTLWCVFSMDGADNGVYFSYSVNNGQSFNDPTKVSDTLSHVDGTYNYQTEDGMLWILWAQSTGPNGKKEVFGTSSPGWSDWKAPTRLVDSKHGSQDPALGEINGSARLFYYSDRTIDGKSNGDIYFTQLNSERNSRLMDDGCLLTESLDDDASPATMPCSDGTTWLVFSSHNDTGESSNIYVKNNLTEMSNRPPVTDLLTADGIEFQDLTPALEFDVIDHDGDNITGNLFWRKMQLGSTADSGPIPLIGPDHDHIADSLNLTISSPLDDANWYEWWLEVRDVREDGQQVQVQSEIRTFRVDVDYPPSVTLESPLTDAVLPYTVSQTGIQLDYNLEEADGDDLHVEIYLYDLHAEFPEWFSIHTDNFTYSALNPPNVVHECSHYISPEYLWTGHEYEWMVEVTDENGTQIPSPPFSFRIEEAPENSPPEILELENVTIKVGDLHKCQPEAADAESNQLLFTWWIFNVSGSISLFNEEFHELYAHCFFAGPIINENLSYSFPFKGSFLVQLNVTDQGTDWRPPGISIARYLVQVIGESEPGIIGEMFSPSYGLEDRSFNCSAVLINRSDLSALDSAECNFTWKVRLGATVNEYYGGSITLSLAKPDNYNITVIISGLLGEEDVNIILQRNITILSKEEWDEKWYLSLKPGSIVPKRSQVRVELHCNGTFPKPQYVKWFLIASDTGRFNYAFEGGANWNFTPIDSGEFKVMALLGFVGFEYGLIRDIVVLPGSDNDNKNTSAPGELDDDLENLLDGRTGRFVESTFWLLIISCALVLILCVILAVLYVRRRKRSDFGMYSSNRDDSFQKTKNTKDHSEPDEGLEINKSGERTRYSIYGNDRTQP